MNNEAISYLRSPSTIRTHCHQLLDLARKNRLNHFQLAEERLHDAVSYVMEEIAQNYPDYIIPYHSRFRHFEVGTDRINKLEQSSSTYSSHERAMQLFELALLSVLLDAGAGEKWSYLEPETGDRYTRSEGLAVASFHLFKRGLFSSHASSPLQADAKGLLTLTEKQLAHALQVSDKNPLIGVRGRTKLLNRLGEAISSQSQFFGNKENPRLGGLFTYLLSSSHDGTLTAKAILQAILESLSTIWPNGLLFQGVNIGDVGYHPLIEGRHNTNGLIPFHKLSQWLSYSLFEPLELAGITITEANELTGLPEYRNGGFLIDTGVLRLREKKHLHHAHSPQSELIVEWRALTVALLDLIGEEVRNKLCKSVQEFPLVKILQGGTWSAGRRIAKEQRTDGSPPLKIESDGTVF